MKKKILIFGVLAVVLAVCLSFNPFNTEKPLQAHAPGLAAPAVSGTNLNGEQVNVDFSAKVTVLNFWATWCPPCRSEMPELNAFASEYAGAVNFYAVNLQENPEHVRKFMQEQGYTMPVIADAGGDLARAYRISVIPTTIIVDKNGVVKAKKVGTVTKAELVELVGGLQ